MNRFYQGDWIDSMASRFLDELPNDYVEKNSFFDEEQNQIDDFEFNQDLEFDDEEDKIEIWLDPISRIK